MKATIRAAIALLLTGGVIILGFSGCFAKKYGVDYGGSKDAFTNAKDAYRAGEEVTLYYSLIATDTDYTFTVDGETVSPCYSEDKGYILSFTMPAHDVTIRVHMRNSMEYIPESRSAAVLTFQSFDGGGPSYSVTVDDETVATFTQTREYANKNHSNMTGAGYTVYIRFIGQTPGSTTARIECRSPIAENFDAVYEITVDENLEVTVTEKDYHELSEP